MRILLVEDDLPLASALAEFLGAKGFVCECAASLQAARALLPLAHWGAVLLDWQLPDGEGLALLPLLRARLPEAAVIVLTARDQITDRIQGLDAGADDYLVKPYDPDELLARLRAVERRRGAADAPVLALGDLQIDLAREQVRRAGVPIALTHKEWALLRVLATRPGRIHTRENLQDALYGWGDETDSNTLEVFISRLRRKLGREHIETLRGIGYRLAQSA